MSSLFHPYKKNGRFYNFKDHEPESFLLGTLPSFVKSLLGRPKAGPIDITRWFDPALPEKRSSALKITWIGHSTFLIQVNNLNILTDPIFGDLSFLFPRLLPPGIAINALPPIDYVLLSHNHRDHMDAYSLMMLKRFHALRILVPEGDKKWFDRRGFQWVDEFTWWEKHDAIMAPDAEPVKFTFLPAIHWSQRGIFDKNKSLWGSWMIEAGNMTVYFGGDTAYGHHFSLIAREFPAIDVALLPVGPCEPRAWMKKNHLNPADAGRAFLELGAQHFIPMHWGVFPFGVDTFDLPIRLLKKWWQESNELVANRMLQVPKAGECIQWHFSDQKQSARPEQYER